jgi:demethylmenaquinone methyltransferase/2-methoxy-6-polyprenyl-1,4-benzoquinol methylase
MFDLIARRYDMINRVLALGMDIGWREQMVEVVKENISTKSTPRILDVATGTADVALLLADRIPNAVVLGVDPSPNMLQVGREKIVDRDLTNRITLEEHDARMGFGSVDAQSFDAATMSFGIRNIVEKEQAFCQIHRVLKDHAVLCILEFSEPDDSFGLLGRTARFFIRHIVPTLGGVLSGKPKEYLHLQNSIKGFPSPPNFVKLIEGTSCDTGSFRVERVTQLAFGSVQLYISRVMHSSVDSDEPDYETSTERNQSAKS